MHINSRQFNKFKRDINTEEIFLNNFGQVIFATKQNLPPEIIKIVEYINNNQMTELLEFLKEDKLEMTGKVGEDL